MLLTGAAILLQSVSSALVFQSLWPTQDCRGPPSVMYRFRLLGLQGVPVLGDVNLPASFYNYSASTPTGITSLGLASALTSKQSCSTWLSDLSFVDYYPSSSYDFWDYSVGDAIPTGSNGQNYCLLKPVSYQNIIDLYGKLAVYIQEGQCTEGLTCGAGGALTVNSTGMCGSNFANTNTTTLNSNLPLYMNQIGPMSFTAIFIPITQANVNIIWRSYAPNNLLFTTFDEPWEIVAVFFTTLSMLFLMLAFFYYLMGYITKNYNVSLLYSAVGHLIWLLSNILTCAYLYNDDKYLGTYVTIVAFAHILRAFATLFSVMQSANILLNIKAPSQFVRYCVYGSLFFVHLVLCGGLYVSWIPFAFWDVSAQTVTTAWVPQFTWWVIIVFTAMSTPPFYLIYKVLQREKGTGGPWARLKSILIAEPTFFILVVLIFMSMSVWVSVRVLDNFYPVIFGSDRVRKAMNSFREFFIAAPFFLNCILLDYTPKVIASIKSMKSRKKPIANLSKVPRKATKIGSNKERLSRFHVKRTHAGQGSVVTSDNSVMTAPGPSKANTPLTSPEILMRISEADNEINGESDTKMI